MEAVVLSIVLAVVTTCIPVLLFLLKSRSSSRLPLPPGPPTLQCIGAVMRAAMNGTLHLEAERWAQQYGDIVTCNTIGFTLVFLNSSRAIREVFADKEREPVTNDRPKTFGGWFTMFNYSDVILGSPTDKDWAKLRKLFHTSIKFYGDGVERFESTVQTEIRRFHGRLLALEPLAEPHAQDTEEGEKGVVEREVVMTDLLSFSMLCVLGVLLTGECPDPNSDLVRQMHKFDHDVNTLSNPSTDAILTVFPFLRHLPGFYGDACRNVKESRAELLHSLFTTAKATRVPGEPRGIVDILLEEQLKSGSEWLTDTSIQCVIMDIVMTAYLTSRESMLDLFLYLQHHPDVMRKIQEEIDRVIGGRMPNIEDRSSLPYTEATILETLRHSSFFPLGVPHECRVDVTVQNFCIPRGSMLFANTWVCHRDVEAFHDPENFRPERFLDDRGEVISAKHPLRQHLLSFGAGKRSCPGENFARSRIFLYVTSLLQHFDVLPPKRHQLLPLHRDSWENGAMLHLKPYHCVLRERV